MDFSYLELEDGHRLRWTETGIEPGARAVVLLLQGRNEFIEKYAEIFSLLAHRGLGVVTFDWRGQGLSSRLLANRQKGHIDDFETYIADLDRVIDAVVRPRWDGPLVMVAHSMGANIGLRCLIRRPRDFAAAAFLSPLWGLPLGPAAMIATYVIAGLARALGTAYAPGGGDYDPDRDRFEGNPLTSSADRFERTHRLKQDYPDIRLGGPTMGWLRASFASIRALDAELAANPPDLPIGVISGGLDDVVDIVRHGEVTDRLPHGALTIIPDGRHELLMERDAILEATLAAIDEVVARGLAAQGRRP